MKAHVPIKISNKMRKALMDEVNRQTADSVVRLQRNLQALVLWTLRAELGFGKKRLLRFHNRFAQAIQDLKDYYMYDTVEETEFVCLYKLKHEVGIDVDELGDMWRIKTVYAKDGDKSG